MRQRGVTLFGVRNPLSTLAVAAGCIGVAACDKPELPPSGCAASAELELPPAFELKGRDAANPREVTRRELLTYASCLRFDVVRGEPGHALLRYANEWPAGDIEPVHGNADISLEHLVASAQQGAGWILAKIYVGDPYFHGIERDSNYVWLDFSKQGLPRVLLIPADTLYPIAVLSHFKWEWLGPDTVLHMRLPMDDTWRKVKRLTQAPSALAPSGILLAWKTAWLESLSPPTQACVKVGWSACWIDFGKDDSTPYSLIRANNGTNSTDGWVQVTGTGCVCVGSKCH